MSFDRVDRQLYYPPFGKLRTINYKTTLRAVPEEIVWFN